MIPILTVLVILTVHWIADFICQSRWMAANKSKEWKPLLVHSAVYTIVTLLGWWLSGVAWGTPYLQMLLVVLITFTCHAVTDYFTSRAGVKLWENGKTQQYFTSLGFDQLLHYLQLFLTWYFLVKV